MHRTRRCVRGWEFDILDMPFKLYVTHDPIDPIDPTIDPRVSYVYAYPTHYVYLNAASIWSNWVLLKSN